MAELYNFSIRPTFRSYVSKLHNILIIGLQVAAALVTVLLLLSKQCKTVSFVRWLNVAFGCEKTPSNTRLKGVMATPVCRKDKLVDGLLILNKIILTLIILNSRVGRIRHLDQVQKIILKDSKIDVTWLSWHCKDIKRQPAHPSFCFNIYSWERSIRAFAHIW